MNRFEEHIGGGLYCALLDGKILISFEDASYGTITLNRDMLVALMQFALRNHVIEENTNDQR